MTTLEIIVLLCVPVNALLVYMNYRDKNYLGSLFCAFAFGFCLCVSLVNLGM